MCRQTVNNIVVANYFLITTTFFRQGIKGSAKAGSGSLTCLRQGNLLRSFFWAPVCASHPAWRLGGANSPSPVVS